MRLPKTALCALLLLASASGIAQDAVPALPPGPGLTPFPGMAPSGVLTPIPGTAPSNYPTIPGAGNRYPELSTGQPGQEPYPAIDPNCPGIGGPTYEIAIDGLFWNVRPALNQPLALRTRDLSTALDTGAQDFGFEPGGRVHIAYLTEEGADFEFGYFGVSQWTANNSIFDNQPGLQLPLDLGNPSFARNFSTAPVLTAINPTFVTQTFQMDFRGSSSINSVEVDLAFGTKDSGTKYLFGARYIKFNERFSISSTTNMIDNVNPVNTGTFTSHYNISTQNEALGLNIGARSRQHLWNCWDLEQVGKVSVLSNAARENQFVGDINDRLTVRNTGASTAPTAFLAEYFFSAVRHISDNSAIRLGYTFVWLDGVARATDQLDFRVNAGAGSSVQLRSGAFMHGVHAGYEAYW